MIPDWSERSDDWVYKPIPRVEWEYDGAVCECCGHAVNVEEKYCKECAEVLLDD